MKPGISKYSRPTTAKKELPSQKKTIKPITMASEQKSPTTQNYQKLQQQIQMTITTQKQCQRSGKYVQAEACKRKVKLLRQQLDQQQSQQIKRRHQKQLIQLQQAHLQEMNIFNLEWDRTFIEFDKMIKEMSSQLAKKHESQIKAIEQEIENQKMTKFKESPRLLELRKIEQQLAKQQDYMQAHKVQVTASKLQKDQLEKWKRANLTKSKHNLIQLKLKHQAELQALNQRISTQMEQKQRERERQQEKLLQKYDNILKQTEFHQNQEIIKFNKNVRLVQNQKKTKPGMMNSTSKFEH